MDTVGDGEKKGDDVVNPTYHRHRIRGYIYRNKDIHQRSKRSYARIEFVFRTFLH